MLDEGVKELREYIIYNTHILLGHPRAQKTYSYLNEYFYWPNSYQNCIEYCQQCDTCQRTKASTQLPYGFAKPLPVPDRPFIHLFMDFLSLPPRTYPEERYDNIYDILWLIVCRHSGLKKLIPVWKETTAKELYILFVHYMYPNCSMLEDIVNDRDSKFTSKEFVDFYNRNYITQSMSTSHHPETDRQIENANK